MSRVRGRLLAQAGLYGLFALLIGYFSAAPAYTHSDSGLAQLKVSFRHAGAPMVECRLRSPEEIAELPANMRRQKDCPRQRVPVHLELFLDDQLVLREVLPPTGLWDDGPSIVYRRFAVEPGRRQLRARLRDSRRSDGYDHQRDEYVELELGRVFVVDFRQDVGGFVFH